ncbi:MAG: hypothetical protein ACOX1H_02955 [Pseudoramibacter sp.]
MLVLALADCDCSSDWLIDALASLAMLRDSLSLARFEVLSCSESLADCDSLMEVEREAWSERLVDLLWLVLSDARLVLWLCDVEVLALLLPDWLVEVEADVLALAEADSLFLVETESTVDWDIDANSLTLLASSV